MQWLPADLLVGLNWKIIAMGATLVPFSAMVVAFFVPESPTFLVQKVCQVRLG